MKIAIITGGETGERSVSIKSATNIQQLIDFTDTVLFTFPEDAEKFIEQHKEFDLAIPMIHGVGGEDGSLQGFLKNLGIPFIFSDVTAHAIAIDKKITKEIVQSLGVRSPSEVKNFPAFVKPRNGGSSVASQLCSSEEELHKLMHNNPAIDFLIEEPIKGQEFTVGVIEYKGKTFTLPVVQIAPKGEFFDFENKYNPEKLASEICPAQIDISLSDELQRQALLVHAHLQVKHISRSDFIVTSKNAIYFLEINTIPGMTDTSLIPKMVSIANLSLKEVLKEWCQL